MLKYYFRTLYIAVIMISSNAFINYAYAQCNLADWQVLQSLYITTYGANWTDNTGWDQVDPFINPSGPPVNCDLGTMFGITLDANDSIVGIDLNNNNLTGIIPSEIGDLVNLTSLVLNNNNLSGSIPLSFANLTNLTQFDISDNFLTGCYDPTLAASNAGGSSTLQPGGTTYVRPQSSTLVVPNFDPTKDIIDVGTESIHNQIAIDGPTGLVFENMFTGASLTLEGIFLKDLQWFNFALIPDAHLQQDLSAALAYENCTGLSQSNTVYVRSHEPGLVEEVNFNPTTDKISFFYLCVRGDDGLNYAVEQTAAGARFYSPYTGQSLTLLGIDFSQLNSNHFEWRANQLEDNLAGRIGLDDVITGFQIINANVFNGQSVPMAGGVNQAPYHSFSYPAYTGTLICELANSALCNFTNADISDGNNFDEPWEDFCATSAGACGATPTPGNCNPTCVDEGYVEVSCADIYITDACKGVILTSPSGLCYRLRVEDDGSFTSELIDCP